MKTQVIHIPDPPKVGEYYYEHRCILRCVLQAEKQTITVFSTHFGLAPAEQENAVQTLLELVAREEGPVLLMGDLNAQPHQPVLKPLMDALHDSCAGVDILTFPSDQPQVKIDHILYRGGWQVQQVYSIDTQNSDHRPLIAKLELQ